MTANNNNKEVCPERCPLCGEQNLCAMANNNQSNNLDCWCKNESIPAALIEQVPPEAKNKSCICQKCAVKYKEAKFMSV